MSELRGSNKQIKRGENPFKKEREKQL